LGDIKVVLYGVGAICSAVANLLTKKRGVKIVGAVDTAKDKVGKDLGEVIGLSAKTGVIISGDASSALHKVHADVAIHATTSYLKDAYPQISQLIENGVNVISTCEELVYPFYSEPELAEKLDALAKKYEVAVLGTGINPGFLMDTLVIALTAVCQSIRRIEAVRVIDAASRRLPFLMKIGAGLTLKDFKRKIAKKQITGHVGLEQSIAMIADALSWDLEGIVTEAVEPIVAAEVFEGENTIKIDAGEVAGIRQKAKGFVDGEEVILLDFQAYVGAKEEYDAITIHGIPMVHQKIQPCVHGDLGTAAILTNLIPKVLCASPGLITMKDLPVPSATPEDLGKCFLHKVRITVQ